MGNQLEYQSLLLTLAITTVVVIIIIVAITISITISCNLLHNSIQSLLIQLLLFIGKRAILIYFHLLRQFIYDTLIVLRSSQYKGLGNGSKLVQSLHVVSLLNGNGVLLAKLLKSTQITRVTEIKDGPIFRETILYRSTA